MKDSIRIRLRADVPVGSYLSGGLDSSGITAFVKNYFNNELRTFGITFQEESFDESEFQNLMIKHLHTNHKKFMQQMKILVNIFQILSTTVKNQLYVLHLFPYFYFKKS